MAISLFCALAAAAWVLLKPGFRAMDRAGFEAMYAIPPAPRPPARVFHLGHSLVGRDMPAMLTQLAGHDHESQLGWGSPLRQHWEPDVPVNGFDVENNHPRFRAGHQAVGSGDYDAIVVTEALGYQSRWPWRRAHSYLRKWAAKAWGANPDTRFYLYATWRGLDDPSGWLAQIDAERTSYWEGEMLQHTLAYSDVTQPIYVIPGGLVMAAVARAAEAQGGIGPIKDRKDLFSDEIHFNDYGAYLMALTHYAVLYGQSPVGLPYDVQRADGTPAASVGAQAAAVMQDIVWQVVTEYAPTGVRG